MCLHEFLNIFMILDENVRREWEIGKIFVFRQWLWKLSTILIKEINYLYNVYQFELNTKPYTYDISEISNIY